MTLTPNSLSRGTPARNGASLCAFVMLLLPTLLALAGSAALKSRYESKLESTYESGDEYGMGTLAGTVVGANGKPVAGSRVTLQDAGASHPDVTLTNAEGRFFFAELSHGYYDVRAYSNGAWSEWKHNIEVKTGRQTEVRLQVVKKPRKAT
jgi:Carboxypeptidase regulatory-like domain